MIINWPKRAKKQLEADTEEISAEDLDLLLKKQKSIEAKIHGSGRLKRFGTDVKLMFSLIRDYWKGEYRDVPWKTIAVIAAALLYVLNPLDLIPDAILLIGLIDDAAVVATALIWVETDLYRYAAWKEARDGSEDCQGDPSGNTSGRVVD